MQIIIIDDGSKDKSCQVYEYYEKTDQRFTVLRHSINKGISAVRNEGISVAKGEYIVFVDADDIVSEFYIEKLYLACIQNDTALSVCGRYYVKDGKTDIQVEENADIYDYIRALKSLLLGTSPSLGSSPWGKIYRKDLFSEIEYPLDCVYEDTATTWKLFIKAKKIAVVPEPLYYYIKREQSITLSHSKQVRENQIKAAKSVQLAIQSTIPELTEEALRFYLDHTLEYLKCDSVPLLDCKDVQKEWKEGYKIYLKDPRLPLKTKIRVFINTYCPIRMLRWIYKII